jgi:uncharacterized protein (TIGR01777 family)
MATILLTGGTGTIGRALTSALLAKDHTVIIVTRDPDKIAGKTPGISYAKWDIAAQTIDEAAITAADHIIHLAGAGVADKRWSAARKKEITDSRVKSGELLVKAISTIPNKIQSIVSASAVGWYGPDKKDAATPFTEEMPPYNDFLGNTCLQWEQSLDPLAALGKRVVKLRTGIVLSNEGGALVEFKKLLRFGVASVLGSGKQVISWIHVDDLVSMYLHAMENSAINGVYNAVSPKPVSNKELILQLARIHKGKFFIPIPVPAFLLKIVLGEMSIEVLKSTTVSAAKIHQAGFVFQFPSIEAALKNLAS